MDASSFSAIGEQLEGFLSKQFTPPDGAQTVLGFFGSGVAVEPASFIGDDGKPNPARVNAWLNIFLDVITSVENHQVGAPVITASQLIQAIAGSAMSTAPVGSDAARVLGKIKDQVAEDLGGATVIQTAPLNWYDPVGVAQWPTFQMNNGSGASAPPTGGVHPIPIGRPPLWTWRSMPRVVPGAYLPAQAHFPMTNPGPRPVLMERPAVSLATVRPTGLAVAESQAPVAPRPVAPGLEFRTLAPLRASAPQGASPPMQLPAAVLAFHQASNSAANQASSRPVDASSMSVALSYSFVSLSRAPWWNDLLLGMANWYVPGQRHNSWIGASTQAVGFGVPIALILTADVQIRAAWSQADRASAASSSHVGPWSLAGARISDTGSSGQSSLQIPSMQAVACIYRIMPALPPQDDPALAGS